MRTFFRLAALSTGTLVTAVSLSKCQSTCEERGDCDSYSGEAARAAAAKAARAARTALAEKRADQAVEARRPEAAGAAHRERAGTAGTAE